MPTLYQVNEVEHGHECKRYEDVAFFAGAGRPAGGDGEAVEVDDETRDAGALAPHQGGQAAHDQEGEDEALDVGVATEAAAQTLLLRTLLKE
ncbi:hypothetical protein NPIL_277481 [Nephila pilipes]|uniref:Uncharacterized protein n=1 Tax=Nephila pilipes TaxID=299642 RepID=A0A8X6T4Z9_NEPPI|nr:hypothetical protein NPIL_277481 [Nephila pilipes]